MLKKSNKRIAGLLAAVAMIGTLGSAMTVMAANTSDTEYRINVESSSGAFKGVMERDKQNDSKVYVNIYSAPTQYTQVRTYGNRNSSVFYNETGGTTAVVKRGVQSSITNYCYENRKSNYTYVLTQVRFRSNASTTGTVTGVWSPDSTKNYTVVN